MATKKRKKSKAKGKFFDNLEIYAFWTGFVSTLISLLQVMIIATKGGG